MNAVVVICTSQSMSTFVYISLLSVVGERLAVRLRTQLFHSLIQRDIAFFDTHRTGELISRYLWTQVLTSDTFSTHPHIHSICD